MKNWLPTLLAMFSPLIEGRGGIPIGVMAGLDWRLVFLVALISAALIFIAVRLVLSPVDKLIPVDRLIPKHNRNAVDKYGPLGLYIISAIPLPLTGVYSSTALSWLFKIRVRSSFVAIMAGAVTSNLIITLVVLGVLTLWVK